MSFWRMEDPVFQEDIVDGNKTKTLIKGGMFKHQRAFWASKSRIKLLVGGYGSGKTMTCAKRSIATALHNAPAPIMIVSPSYKVAKRTIIPEIKNLLNGRNIKYEFKVQDSEFNIYYKGRHAVIWVSSGDNPELLKGPNLACAYIDEPFIQDREVFMQLMARLRHPGASLIELGLFGTPEQLNWGYDISEGEDKDDYDIEVIRAKTTDNKANPDSYIESLKNMYDDKLVQAYMNGEFVNLAKGTIYYGFKRDDHIKNFDYIPGREIMVGMDFNVNPMSAVLFYEYDSVIYVLEEIELMNSNTQLMAETVRDRIFSYNKNQTGWIKCYPDPAGNQRKTSANIGTTDLSILEQNNFTIFAHSKTKSVRDTYNAVNTALYKDKLIIHPRCRALIKGLERLNFEEFKKQGDLTHMTDAMKYPIHYIMPIDSMTSTKFTMIDL